MCVCVYTHVYIIKMYVFIYISIRNYKRSTIGRFAIEVINHLNLIYFSAGKHDAIAHCYSEYTTISY